MRFSIRLLSAALLVASAACASVQTGAYFDQALDLAPHRTFAFDTPDALPTGDPRLDANPFFDSRMRSAVELELTFKGLRLASTSPDLLVHYHASVSQRMDVIRSDQDRGYSNVTGVEPTVIQFDEGTLLVDVVDARSKKVIWRGWARADIGRVLDDAHAMDRFIHEAVHKMFERFPAK